MIFLIISIFILILFLIIFKSKIEEINILFFIILILALTALAAFRVESSVKDYELYVGAWNYATFKNTTIEASFLIIRNFLKDVLLLKYQSLFIVYAILGVFSNIIGIKKLTTLFYLSLLFFVSNYYILHELTQMRAGVAAGFMLIAIKPLYDRNLKLFILFAAIATVFHYSAVIIFPLWFIGVKEIRQKWMYYLIPAGYLFYFIGFDLVQKIPIEYFQIKLDTYRELTRKGIDNNDKINVFNGLFLLKIIVFYILLFSTNKIKDHSKYLFLLLKIEAISLFCFTFLAAIPALAYRVHEFLSIVEVILYPLIIYAFRYKFVGYLVAVLICIGFFLINIFYNNLIV